MLEIDQIEERLVNITMSEKIIMSEDIFKSDKCLICLNNLPNVLFCNCGHLCICKECDKLESLNICPVCKTENTIKRNIY